jgi:hypothetical protein
MNQLRIIVEQNGMINLFSMAFSTLLYLRTRRGYIERLLIITSYSSFIADCMLVFTNGPSAINDLSSVRAMVFFEVIFWTIRELGLTLYTNKLIKILDYQKSEKIYYIGYNSIFALMSLWRILDVGLRTYDPYVAHIEGRIVTTASFVYLGALSCIDLWSSIFLLKTAFIELKNTRTDSNIYKLMKDIAYSGISRVIFINFIPLIRLIVSLTITSSFNYENDVSIIVYALQVSMNLMYLIDLSIIKIESNNIFSAATLPERSGDYLL